MFVGWFAREPSRTASVPKAQTLTKRLDPFGGGDRTGSWSGEGVVLAQSRIHSTAHAARETMAAVCPATGNVLLSWLRLDNRAELGAALGLDSPQVAGMSDADLVLAGYRAWTTGVAQRLEGEFSFAIWEPKERRVYLARDVIGTRPLFYSATPHSAAFGTSLAALQSLPDVDDAPDPMWLARFLVAGKPGGAGEGTAFLGVRRLPRAHWAMIGTAGLITQRYFEFDDAPPWEDTRDPAWLAAYRNALEQAVSDRIHSEDPLGIENSGGLDSSSLIALAAMLRPEKRRTMHTFGYVVYSREVELALATSRLWQVGTNHIFTRWDGGDPARPDEREKRQWLTMGHPDEHGNVSGHWEVLVESQRVGVRLLLSGHGGDEAVTNGAQPALDEFARRGRWDLVRQQYPGPALLRGPRTLRRRLFGTSTMAGHETFTAHNRRDRERWLRSVLDPDVAAELLSDERSSTRERDQLHALGSSTVNGNVLWNLESPAHYARVEQGSILAASFGVEYTWPLFDRRLIQQYLSTPTIWKFGDGAGRYLHREAMAGLLPEEIRTKNTKNMGVKLDVSPDGSPAYSAPPNHLSNRDLAPELDSVMARAYSGSLPSSATAATQRLNAWFPTRARRLNDWLLHRSGTAGSHD